MISKRILLVGISYLCVDISVAQEVPFTNLYTNGAGVISPSEVLDVTSVFKGVVPDGNQLSSFDAQSSYINGGAIYFSGDEDTGVKLLTYSANEGNGNAALTLGIAAEKAGSPQAAYTWFLKGAESGNVKAITLQGRSQLYGVGTDREVETGVTSLLDAYKKGDFAAAADLAKAATYHWNDTIQVPTDTLWQHALMAKELQPKVEYLRYLKAGAVANQQMIEGAAKAIIEGDPFWGAVASWDVLSQDDRANNPYVFDALKPAHELGNIDATERLGAVWSLSEDAEERKVGIEYLFGAAKTGRASAYTSIAKYYLQYPDAGMDRNYALSQLQAAILLGDNDANQVFAEYLLADGKPVEAFDRALLVTASGTQQAKLLADENLDEACANPAARCEEILVGYVTSRRADPNGGYTSLPTEDFEPEFGFAKVMVPTADIPEQEGFDLWKVTWNGLLSILGWQPAPTDLTSRASIWLTPGLDWAQFEQALARRNEETSVANKSDVLLFVHGVNTSFRSAVTSAARLKVKANLPGLPIVYSWPALSWFKSSEGVQNGVEYLADTNTAARNCNAFQRFLVKLTKTVNREHLTLIAHSHGAELLENGLTTCKGAPSSTERVAVTPKIKSIIYAAPDIDRDVFEDIVPQVVKMSGRVTMYASDADLALYIAGDVLSRNPKAGMGGANPSIVDGMETIDISNLSSRTMSVDGHGYLLTMGAVLDDLNEIILHGSGPEVRCLQKREVPQQKVYWQFREGCAQ